ncbi:MAG TPA: SpoIIE family protein phosphatase [Solirubrobacteraceae bacterium]|nr:SpoIIE family protein phosphatase [Solirubrobacteraceae bacterium]
MGTATANSHVWLRLSSRADNVIAVRQALSGFADATGLSPAELSDIGTAVTEACNNVSEHAYAGEEGPVEMQVLTQGEEIVVTVRDWGVGMAMDGGSPVEFPSDVDGELAGLGVPSIKALATQVRWSEPVGGGTAVEMTFETPSLGRRGLHTGEPTRLFDGEPSWPVGAIRTGMAPAPVVRSVLPRLLRVLAARVQFSVERHADVQRVAAAVLATGASSWIAQGAPTCLVADDDALDVTLGPMSEEDVSRLAVAVGAVEPNLSVSIQPHGERPRRLVLRLERSPARARSLGGHLTGGTGMPAVERGERRPGWAVALLVETGATLSRSLDPATTMSEVAKLTIPALADLCVVDLANGDDAIGEIAAASADPDLAAGLEELRSRFPLDIQGPHPVARVIRTGEPELLAEMGPESLRSFAQASEHARFMIANGYRSAIVAPLTARGRTLGALSTIRLAGGETYDPDDLELVCELARRAALAIDNARLFSDLQTAERRLQAVLENLAEAITLVDRSGRTVFANEAALTLLGLESADALVDAKPGEVMSRFLVLSESGEELSLEEMPARRLFRGEPVEPLLVRNIVRATGEERWIIVRASPIVDPRSSRVMYAANVFEDVTEVKRAQLAEGFMAQASRVLASSMDYTETLGRVAKLAAGDLADWCAVDVLGERDRIERVAVYHRDPEKLALAEQLDRSYRPALEDPVGVPEVIRTGQARLFNDIGEHDLAKYARDAEHLRLLTEMGARDVIIVPLAAATRTLGAITLVSSRHGRRLGDADLGVAVRLGRRAGIAVESARLYTERSRIARVLQRALLPDSLPEVPGFEVAARHRPAGELNEVGGDFYDVFPYRNDTWMLLIGDVCGKGPEAASVTALARHTLRTAAMLGTPPAAMLELLHDALRSQEPEGQMCTVCLVVVDSPETHVEGKRARLRIALAGHPRPLIVEPAGRSRAVGEPGTILGMVDPVVVNEATVELDDAETLLLYTDGVTDAARSRTQAALDLESVIALARELALGEMLAAVEAAAVTSAGGQPQDDIALVALRIARGRSAGAGGPPAAARRGLESPPNER